MTVGTCVCKAFGGGESFLLLVMMMAWFCVILGHVEVVFLCFVVFLIGTTTFLE